MMIFTRMCISRINCPLSKSDSLFLMVEITLSGFVRFNFYGSLQSSNALESSRHRLSFVSASGWWGIPKYARL